MIAAATTSKPAVELRVFSQQGQNTCSATIKSDDASFIETVCSNLNSLAPFPGFKASIEPIKFPVSQSPCQVHCRKVHCAWSLPTREARLIFGDKVIPLSAHKNLSNIFGSDISIFYPQGWQDEGKWVIKAEGLSSAMKEQDFLKAILELDRPQTIHFEETSYDFDADRDSGIVKSMLEKFGSLEEWSVSFDAKLKRIHAYATFFHESSARDAVAILHNTRLSLNETAKLSVTLVASASYEIEAKIYDMISPQVENLETTWKRQHINVSKFPLKYPLRMLKLECENHQFIVQAKRALEKVITGQIVKMDGRDLRFGNFRQNGTAFKWMKLVGDSFKVVIIPDIRRSQFRIFGPEKCSQLVLDQISKMLQHCAPEGHAIELERADFFWALNGGLRLLKSRLGEEKVSFHVLTQRNKRIFISGSKQDYNNAVAIIASKQTISAQQDLNSEMECPSCLSEAEDPIRMSCGHVYCSDCFIQMCEAEKTAKREFRICCVKITHFMGTECQRSFSLSELQVHLPANVFETVLEKSFESYVSRHPDNFAYCQTADCDQVYRVSPLDSERPRIFTCKKCLVPICTFCHSLHSGKPCDRTKRIDESALSDKTKKALGIKSCPKCSILMEKQGGCNHVTCKCGIYVCWVCLMSFRDSAACYNHINNVHGGFWAR